VRGFANLEPRLSRSGKAIVVAPVAAVIAAVLVLSIAFLAIGRSPVEAVYYFFIAPFASVSNLGEVLLDMSPLLLIAQGLAIGFRARIWNIGAEGQLVIGAIAGSLLPIYLNSASSPLILPAMVVLGGVGGMSWAGIAAFLRAQLNTNEVLVTLMLNSVAYQILYFLVSGPLRDPHGFNFPQSVQFQDAATFPLLISGMRVNASIFIGLGVSVLAWLFVHRSFLGFKLRVCGAAPMAARYAGFSQTQAIWISLMIGGCAAGIAGVSEVAGPLGQLQRVLSPGYGYSAIVVAFLGALDPLGIVLSSFLMAVIYVGGDLAQTSAGVSYAMTTVLLGVLLVTYLATRLFVDYRIRFRWPEPRRGTVA
jgi:general nucleoside transport system permease protein